MSLYDIVKKSITERIYRRQASAEAVEAANRVRAEMEVSIRRLPSKERLILACFVATGQHTLDLPMFDDSVETLLQRGMLNRFNGFSGGGFRAAHSIDPDIYDFIDHNRSLLTSEWAQLEKLSKADEPLF